MYAIVILFDFILPIKFHASRQNIQDAIKVFPLLFECDRNDRKILKGILNIVDSNGKHWESYEVEIHCPENYPEQFPILFETSDKIPKIGDWHIYEDTLAYCVKVQPEEILRCKEGITLTKYIQEEGLALFV